MSKAVTTTKTRVPAKRGRPSKYSDALALTICERIAAGESLRTICADDAMPSCQTVFNWLADPAHADFLTIHARAREMQGHAYTEEGLEIIDAATPLDLDVRIARTEYRKWLAGRLAPKVFGDPAKGPQTAIQINTGAMPPPPP